MRESRVVLTWLVVWPVAFAAPASQPWDIVFTQVPAAQRATYGEGGRLVRLARDGSARTLTAQLASATDPAVSFDGRRILFAGKKTATDPWNIYEMNADGADLRQITRDLGDCRSPIYQSPIFYLDDPGPMPQIAFVHGDAVYSARLDGSGVRRLTYNPYGAFDPAMLPDGRMLFSGGMRERVELLAVNIDGTDYATFSGGQGSRTKRMACVTAKRLVLFVEGENEGGPLAVIDLRRNLHSYRRLALPPGYLYHSPSAAPDGAALVSRRPAKGGAYAIFHLDPETGQLDPVFSSPGKHAIEAQALAPRAVPDGRSSVVDEKQAWAKLYCLSLYESDLGAGIWPKGLVKRIRFLEALAQPDEKRLLGEVDADADGSFHVQIPANLPVQMQALDADGMALRTSAWIWAKNKEQRGCIGCHEDGERTPDNVMASALTRPAANLMLPPERRRRVTFEGDVAPILAQRCASCHSGAARPKLSYESLLRYVTPGAARTSALVWALAGRNTSRAWDKPAQGPAPQRMPPAGSPPLTAVEKRAIIEWIDLGGRR
jgi:hypothetical protein